MKTTLIILTLLLTGCVPYQQPVNTVPVQAMQPVRTYPIRAIQQDGGVIKMSIHLEIDQTTGKVRVKE